MVVLRPIIVLSLAKAEQLMFPNIVYFHISALIFIYNIKSNDKVFQLSKNLCPVLDM